MGGMMATSGYPWILILLWTLLGLLVVTGGVVVARVVSNRQQAHSHEVRATEPPASPAQDALRLRYARGEISREDYLQGKVELED